MTPSTSLAAETDPEAADAGQAPFLRRADHRGGRGSAWASSRPPATPSGPTPGPGCSPDAARVTSPAFPAKSLHEFAARDTHWTIEQTPPWIDTAMTERERSVHRRPGAAQPGRAARRILDAGLRRRSRRCAAGWKRLLREHEQAGSFLEQPAAAPGAHRACSSASGEKVAAAATEGPGTVIGPYKLLQQIGEGGMGTVCMAEQTQPVQPQGGAQAHQARHGLAARSSPASRPSGRPWP